MNVSLVAGRTAPADFAVYAATKWGMNGWSESLRLERQPDICVIVIEPGAVATELTEHITHLDSKRAAQEATANTHIAPKDIAEVIAFAVGRPHHVALNGILVRPTAPGALTSNCPRDLYPESVDLFLTGRGSSNLLGSSRFHSDQRVVVVVATLPSREVLYALSSGNKNPASTTSSTMSPRTFGSGCRCWQVRRAPSHQDVSQAGWDGWRPVRWQRS